MKYDIILAGVGGQGILTIAYVLDNAALASGLHFKQAEVHGMAQRGGAVQSHLRISDQPIHSDLIGLGGADLILAVEPLEALRYERWLRPDGAVIANIEPHVNIPDYPPAERVLGDVQRHARHTLVDAKRLARLAGSTRSENLVMVGAAAPLLPLAYDTFGQHVEALFGKKGPQVVAANLRALAYGRGASLLYQAGRQADLPAEALVLLARRLVCDVPDAVAATALIAAGRELFGPRGQRFRSLVAELDVSLPARAELFAQWLAAGDGLDAAQLKAAALT